MQFVYAVQESDGSSAWVLAYYTTREAAEKHLPADTYFESYEVVEHPVLGE